MTADKKKLSSIFTDEQREIIDLILEVHDSNIREHITKEISDLKEGMSDKHDKDKDKIFEEIEETNKRIGQQEIAHATLDAKFKIKSGIWTLIGGVFTGTAILIWSLIKGS